MKIISADERMRERSRIKGLIAGEAKIGKTSLLWTLDPNRTLFVDLEAGGLSVQGWQGDSIEIKTWDEARFLAAILGGPNPARAPAQCYSQAHFEAACREYGDPAVMDKYETIFVDSITVASRLAFQWAARQPELVTKSGAIDTRGAYGLLGREMIAWITQLQHIGMKNIWFVSLLDRKMDDFNRPYYELQIEGSKTALELPGILDEVITMTELNNKDGAPYRAFICQKPNQWGFPAGDRSGKLDMVEQPHLGKLMGKIKTGARLPVNEYQYEGAE